MDRNRAALRRETGPDRESGAFKGAFADPIPAAAYGMIGLTTVLCVLMIYIRLVKLDEESYRFLLWNLFLAWLPLTASLLAVGFARRARGAPLAAGLALLGAGWLLVYPNAPYLTTDFIHLIIRRYDMEGLLVWYDLVVFFLFSWCGLLLGYVSMRHFHAMVRHFLHPAAGWLFVAGAAVLGGFGIYLGRVVRLNSWDALFSPFRLIEGVLEGLNRQAFIFTALFGLLILVLYGSIYALGRQGVSANAKAHPDG